MTVIAVKDGIMACDSLVTMGAARAGQTLKFRAVDAEHGGGWAAGAGCCEEVARALDHFAINGGAIEFSGPEDRRGEYIHLRADGTVALSDGDAWVVVEELRAGRGFAIGSGAREALAALHMGASAVGAVNAAIALNVNCGGAVWELLAGDIEAVRV